MAVTSGFFNSLNGDRKYNAEQFSALFDNLITDGVFMNVGTAFEVLASDTTENVVTVGIGRAWFNSIWVYNDALYPMTAQDPEVLLDRIDAIVIEINHNEAVRTGSIRWVYGTPSSTPVRPTLTNTDVVHQYPLAYVHRKASVTAITQADITNAIGTSECPYVTGILETQSIDKIVAQWESQFYNWFDGLEASLEGDVAANLASQVLDLQSRFQTLARERAVYEELQDSTGATIQDNTGGDILARTVLGVTEEMIINYNPGQATGGGGDVETFKVGDILTTKRNDLDSTWLLCNGQTVSAAEYPDLAPFDTNPLMKSYFVKNEGDDPTFSPAVRETGPIEYANGYYFYKGTRTYNTYYDRAVIVYSTSINGPWRIKNLTSGGGVNSGTDWVGFVNGYYVAIVTEQGTSRYSTSVYYTQNISGTWTKGSDILTSLSGRTVNSFIGMAYRGGYYVAVRPGENYNNDTRAYYSTSLDGTWDELNLYITVTHGIKVLNNRFFVYGSYEYNSSSSTEHAFAYFSSPKSSQTLVRFDSNYDAVYDMDYIDGKYVAYIGQNAFRESSTLTSSTGSWILHKDNDISLNFNSGNVFTSENFLYADGKYIFFANDASNMIDMNIKICFSESLDGPWTIWEVYQHAYSSVYDRPMINYLRLIGNQYVFSGESKKANSTGPYGDRQLLYMWPDTSQYALPSISISEDTYTYIKVKE